MIYLFLANGFEEIEALATLDVLRRCGLQVTTVSVHTGVNVTAAHGLTVQAEKLFAEVDLEGAEALVLPGGMPGAQNLLEHEGLRAALCAQHARGGLVAAICAAPMVLGQHGLLAGRTATCYPGFEPKLTDAKVCADYVVADGNVITGKGPAAAVEFAFTIAGRFVPQSKIAEVRAGMLF